MVQDHCGVALLSDLILGLFLLDVSIWVTSSVNITYVMGSLCLCYTGSTICSLNWGAVLTIGCIEQVFISDRYIFAFWFVFLFS